MKCIGKTDKGMERQSNQDDYRIAANKKYTIGVVCDGMGGVRGGKIASRTAIVAFMKSLKSALSSCDIKRTTSGDYERMLVSALDFANTAVYEKAAAEPIYYGMGTTLVAFLYVDNKTFVINTGDSRLYMQKDGEMKQITKDHSYVQLLVDKGIITEEEAYTHPQKNIITKVVGAYEETDCDVFVLNDYDRLLLCSDGLTNMLTNDEIADVLISDMDEEKKAEALIDLANAKGGLDNITAIVFCRKEI